MTWTTIWIREDGSEAMQKLEIHSRRMNTKKIFTYDQINLSIEDCLRDLQVTPTERAQLIDACLIFLEDVKEFCRSRRIEENREKLTDDWPDY